MRRNVVALRVPARTALQATVSASPRTYAPRRAMAQAAAHNHRASWPRVALPRATPPPTSERSLTLQRLYAQHRPLLEHEQLPARPTRLMQGDTIVVDSEDLVVPRPNMWRRRARSVDAKTFSGLIDGLARLSVTPGSKVSGRKTRTTRRASSRGFAPSSPVVQAASKHIEKLERDADVREQVIANAVEHGEDVERAARLGAEAELVVLGEPQGAHKDWAPGVATHLGSHTQPYVPPSAFSSTYPRRVRARTVDDFDVADEDAHLWLMQGLVHTRVGADHDWRSWLQTTLGHDEDASVSLDSVRRKRRKKMNKHKYKKLRKRQRAERQRLKK